MSVFISANIGKTINFLKKKTKHSTGSKRYYKSIGFGDFLHDAASPASEPGDN